MIQAIQAIAALELPEDKKIELIRVLVNGGQTAKTPVHTAGTPLPPQFIDPTALDAGAYGGIRPGK